MAETEKFSFPSCDGMHQIHARLWLPQQPPRGVVQIVHGVAEHMGRYEDTARYLTEHGFAVCGEDHLGHGLTAEGGTFGYFGPKNGWDTVVQDVHQLRQRMGERFPGLPYFILGHSMGSFLTRTYLIRWPGTVTARSSALPADPCPHQAPGVRLTLPPGRHGGRFYSARPLLFGRIPV